jgi:hypothetical protein
MLIALIVLISTVSMLLFVGLLAGLRAKSELRERADNYEALIDGFITSTDDKTPSQLAVAAQMFAGMISTNLMASIQGKAMGEAGLSSRQEKAIKGAILEDQIEAKVPALSGIFNAMPNLKKTVMKNQGLLEMFSNLITSASMQKHPDSNGGRLQVRQE